MFLFLFFSFWAETSKKSLLNDFLSDSQPQTIRVYFLFSLFSFFHKSIDSQTQNISIE